MKSFETSLTIVIPEALGWIDNLYFQIMLKNKEVLPLPGEYLYSYISQNGLEWPKINGKQLHLFINNYATSVFKVNINSDKFSNGQYYCTFEASKSGQKRIFKTDLREFLLEEFNYTKYI